MSPTHDSPKLGAQIRDPVLSKQQPLADENQTMAPKGDPPKEPIFAYFKQFDNFKTPNLRLMMSDPRASKWANMVARLEEADRDEAESKARLQKVREERRRAEAARS